jgi:phosphatidylglycerophosphatase A
MTKEIQSKSKSDFFFLFFATCGFTSYVPSYLTSRIPHKELKENLEENKRTGSGLMGSIVGAVCYQCIPGQWSQSFLILTTLTGLSVYVAGKAEKILENHDDSRIVIDEWIGVLVAMWGMSPALNLRFLITFGFFRFFDVFKGPIGRRLQKLPGGWGVVVDDIYAGVLANLSWRLLDITKTIL